MRAYGPEKYFRKIAKRELINTRAQNIGFSAERFVICAARTILSGLKTNIKEYMRRHVVRFLSDPVFRLLLCRLFRDRKMFLHIFPTTSASDRRLSRLESPTMNFRTTNRPRTFSVDATRASDNANECLCRVRGQNRAVARLFYTVSRGPDAYCIVGSFAL